MDIYIRTRQGQAAALNPHSPLPRKLRTLLVSIDGKTAMPSHAKHPSSSDDIAGQLKTLVDADLIEVLPGTESEPEPAPAQPVDIEPDAVADWERTAVLPRP